MSPTLKINDSFLRVRYTKPIIMAEATMMSTIHLAVGESFSRISYSVMFGSSRPMPFFLSTTFSTKPRMRAATPRQANITNGAV